MANLQNARLSRCRHLLSRGFASPLLLLSGLLLATLPLLVPSALQAADDPQKSAAPPSNKPPQPLAIQVYCKDQGITAWPIREIELLTGTDRGGALTVLRLEDTSQVHVLQIGLSARDVFRFYRYDKAGQLTSLTEIEATFPWNTDKGELEYSNPQPQPAKTVKPGTKEWQDWQADAEVLQAIATDESKSRDIGESIIRK